MNVIELTADNAEDFLARQPVTAILYYTPADPRIFELLDEFKSVTSDLFRSVMRILHAPVTFGSIDLTATENLELLAKGVIVMTPTVIYYYLGEPTREDVGYEAIMDRLQNQAPVFWYRDIGSCL